MDPLNLSLKVPAIEKLIDYGASGVGVIAGPLLAPWKASREGKARLLASEADAQVRQIQARADASALNIIAEAQSEAQAYLLPVDADIRAKTDITREGIAQSIEFQGRKRLANAGDVLEAAAEELGDKEVNDHDPDPDWTARFFDYVQDVSTDDMQKIWANILAGEVESPGRTSLRTLDTLRNITKTEAEIFNNLCDFVLGGGLNIVFHEIQYSTLNHLDLVRLQDCGLVHFGQSVYNIDSEISRIEYQNLYLQITRNTQVTKRIPFQIATLTKAGTELYQITEPQLRIDYLKSFAKFLHSKNCQLSYSKVIKRDPDGTFHYRAHFTPILSESDQADEATP